MPSCASYADLAYLHSFPTRRSSDLASRRVRIAAGYHQGRRSLEPDHVREVPEPPVVVVLDEPGLETPLRADRAADPQRGLGAALDVDRKSTRLNSSHLVISYAVLCFLRRPRVPPLFPYTTLFRSGEQARAHRRRLPPGQAITRTRSRSGGPRTAGCRRPRRTRSRSSPAR